MAYLHVTTPTPQRQDESFAEANVMTVPVITACIQERIACNTFSEFGDAALELFNLPRDLDRTAAVVTNRIIDLEQMMAPRDWEISDHHFRLNHIEMIDPSEAETQFMTSLGEILAEYVKPSGELVGEGVLKLLLFTTHLSAEAALNGYLDDVAKYSNWLFTFFSRRKLNDWINERGGWNTLTLLTENEMEQIPLYHGRTDVRNTQLPHEVPDEPQTLEDCLDFSMLLDPGPPADVSSSDSSPPRSPHQAHAQRSPQAQQLASPQSPSRSPQQLPRIPSRSPQRSPQQLLQMPPLSPERCPTQLPQIPPQQSPRITSQSPQRSPQQLPQMPTLSSQRSPQAQQITPPRSPPRSPQQSPRIPSQSPQRSPQQLLQMPPLSPQRCPPQSPQISPQSTQRSPQQSQRITPQSPPRSPQQSPRIPSQSPQRSPQQLLQMPPLSPQRCPPQSPQISPQSTQRSPQQSQRITPQSPQRSPQRPPQAPGTYPESAFGMSGMAAALEEAKYAPLPQSPESYKSSSSSGPEVTIGPINRLEFSDQSPLRERMSMPGWQRYPPQEPQPSTSGVDPSGIPKHGMPMIPDRYPVKRDARTTYPPLSPASPFARQCQQAEETMSASGSWGEEFMSTSGQLPGAESMSTSGQLPGAESMSTSGGLPGAESMSTSGELPGAGFMSTSGQLPGEESMSTSGDLPGEEEMSTSGTHDFGEPLAMGSPRPVPRRPEPRRNQ